MIGRRELLKAIGAGATAAGWPGLLHAAEAAASAAGAATSTAAADLKTKAKQNLKLGIFTGVYGHLPLEEAVRRIKEDGFSRVVLQYHFKDVQFDPLSPDFAALNKIIAALGKQEIQVAGLYGYYNVIDPNEERRHAGESRMQMLIENWKRFGSPIISTETGTFNKDSEFAEDPRNYTEEGYRAVRAAFQRIARAAEKSGATVAIEPYWRNIIDGVARAERLFADLKSPALKLTMDPCNYYRNEDLDKVGPMLTEIFTRVGGQTVLAHAKDIKAGEKGSDTPAPGLGVLDYPLYLRLLAGLDREIPLMIEHLAIEDVKRARDYVLAQMEKI